ncbi:MAG: flagellar biosynthesis protein FlhB [Rickettsiales bacterium]
MADDDDNEKTEEPSHRRLEQAKERGQVPFSRELVSFGLFLGMTPIVLVFWPAFWKGYAIDLSPFLDATRFPEINADVMKAVAKKCAFLFLSMFLAPSFALFVVMVIFSAAQHELIWSADPVKPKGERISPLAGFKRIFSMKSLMEFFKGLLKIIAVAAVAYVAVYPDAPILLRLFALEPTDAIREIAGTTFKLLLGVCVFMGMAGGLDYFYQRFEHVKSLRMSLKEIKDEYKETEGNPEVKAKLRQIRQERANNRMMAAVPTADAVISNPTHYAVAITYEMEKFDAPRVVAKGQDNIALIIRKTAEENDVPVIENPPLARALYNSAEVGDVIPSEYYRAVAEIIRYVYKLKGKL